MCLLTNDLRYEEKQSRTIRLAIGLFSGRKFVHRHLCRGFGTGAISSQRAYYLPPKLVRRDNLSRVVALSRPDRTGATSPINTLLLLFIHTSVGRGMFAGNTRALICPSSATKPKIHED
jgi:hypothetical protein